MFEPAGLDATLYDTIAPVEVGPGCLRRDLPSRAGARVWVVHIVPGAERPRVDAHDDHGEDGFVMAGEPIEGERRLGPGACLHHGPKSPQRLRNESGVRLNGFNLCK